MDLDKEILRTFDMRSEFFFPIICQEEAKSFVKALIVSGVSCACLCAELQEPEGTFMSWKNGLARSGVGKKMVRRINQPLERYLWSLGELEELERDVHKEVERIRDTKNARLKVQERIVQGRKGTSKEGVRKKVSNFVGMKKAVGMDGKDGRATRKVSKVKNWSSKAACWAGEDDKGEDFTMIKLKKVGRPDLYGDEKGSEKGEEEDKEEDKKEDKEVKRRSERKAERRAQSRHVALENNDACVAVKDIIANFNNNSNDDNNTDYNNDDSSINNGNNNSNNDNSNINNGDYNSNNDNSNINNGDNSSNNSNNDDVYSETESSEESVKMAECQSDKPLDEEEEEEEEEDDDDDDDDDDGDDDDDDDEEEKEEENEEEENEKENEDNEEEKEEKEDKEEEEEGNEEKEANKHVSQGSKAHAAASDDKPCDFLYVLSDSNSCSNSPVRKHRFKVGVTECPEEELKKASQFNLDIKLISATAVCRAAEVLEALQRVLQDCRMEGKDDWFFCPLPRMLQCTSRVTTAYLR